MEKIVEQGLLYDFYGELLTEHQKKIYEDAVYGDLSLSEIGEKRGISRQGVHDLVRRCDRALEEYERRLGLVARFMAVKQKVETLKELIKRPEGCTPETMAQIGRLADEILEEM